VHQSSAGDAQSRLNRVFGDAPIDRTLRNCEMSGEPTSVRERFQHAIEKRSRLAPINRMQPITV
jgi:hypothetical protein